MAHQDNAAAIRDRAYAIWEREGRPVGREHEHWAEAAREIEREAQEEVDEAEPAPVTLKVISDNALIKAPSEDQEIDRMRRKLWEPMAFSTELFGNGEEEGRRVPLIRRRLGSGETRLAS
ncbi:DUF2934 domain-containing protein [Mangrovicella endophytica]|uniref:DUF2934 domain-containing protein n=1 Tax=Mangrovicella endophytica TaxID=2066697 RepID=UPI000C9EAF49|nr:DUF2934 domain-containing protein [Mangrovicella endophytica]